MITEAATRRRLAGLLVVLALLSSTSTVPAQTKSDAGLWLMAFGKGGLSGVSEGLSDYRWWLDIQPRFSDDADGLDHLLLRPGLGYAFEDNATAWLGYAWIGTEGRDGSGDTRENRIWQQLTWSPSIESFNLSSRSRLEQRFLDAGDDVGWRFRQFFKATYPLPSERRVLLTAYDEVFFDLNDTDWGTRTGFGQNRLWLGLGWNPDGEGRTTWEIGYLNQFINRQGGTDSMNHILSLNVLFKF